MRTDLRRRTAAAVRAAACAAPAMAQTTWNASLWGAPRSSTQPFEWYAKEAAAKTGGQVKIEIVYGNSEHDLHLLPYT